MMENEDSVVTSLNELRKLKNERITRQGQSRSKSRPKRTMASADDPAADQPTPGPVVARAALASVPAASAQPSPAGFSLSSAVFAPTNYASSPVPAPTVIRTKNSYKAAAVVAVVLLGAGGAGYVSLQNEAQALLAAKDASLKQVEEARGKAVEQAARVEQTAKSNLRQCEEKLKAALAVVPPPASVPSPAPVVAPVVKKSVKAASRGRFAGSKAASRSSRRSASAASAKEKSSAETPLIAKKKRLDNDPLSGLGKR